MNGLRYRISEQLIIAIIEAALSVIAIIVAVLALLYSTQPSLWPSNKNHFNRAATGDIESQLFLADYFYEVGDFAESIYWYKVAIVTATVTEHKAFALNNLGYLYALNYGVANTEGHNRYAEDNAIRLFAEASITGNEYAIWNLYILWTTTPPTFFTDRDFDEEIIAAREALIEKERIDADGIYIRDDLFTEWEYVGTEIVNTPLQNDDNTRYIGRSTDSVRENDTVRYFYTYDVYRRIHADNKASLEYQPYIYRDILEKPNDRQS